MRFESSKFVNMHLLCSGCTCTLS